MERLSWYKQVNGLSLEQLGADMGRDPEQLSDWLRGRHIPCRSNRKEVELFLSGHVQGPEAVQRSGAAVPEESTAANSSKNPFMARTTSEMT